MKKNLKNEFPQRLSDEQLLDLVQRQTLKYFWDFACPTSGMARERSNAVAEYDWESTVATGATGFGIMAMLSGVKRGWLKAQDVQERVAKIVSFLENAEKHHGAFPHHIDGKTGKTLPFDRHKDNGGDIVETSFLMAGLLCARQYFSGNSPDEEKLRDSINTLWEDVEWNWYTKGTKDKLYWHWSPDHDWEINLRVKGWNETLVTMVLAAGSPTSPISDDVYKKGWKQGSHYKNGKSYHDITLPLGPSMGGPLFLSQYSFMGLDPRGLKDKNTNYFTQNRNHTLINRAHCIENPKGYKGYGPQCWGLTASDNHEGYAAHSPTHDNGTISPTAALSAFPYTPEHSMTVLRHLYEDKHDGLWGPYGFYDAFNETENWCANNYIGIDQGPIVVMIENHRSGLLWDLFMSCPEVKAGLNALKFESPCLHKPEPPYGSKVTCSPN